MIISLLSNIRPCRRQQSMLCIYKITIRFSIFDIKFHSLNRFEWIYSLTCICRRWHLTLKMFEHSTHRSKANFSKHKMMQSYTFWRIERQIWNKQLLKFGKKVTPFLGTYQSTMSSGYYHNTIVYNCLKTRRKHSLYVIGNVILIRRLRSAEHTTTKMETVKIGYKSF